MPSDIFLFRPRNEISSAENLGEFIRMCRDDLHALGRSLPWHSVYWPAEPGSAYPGVTFTRLGENSKTLTSDSSMSEPFVSFAKAYYRYDFAHKPTKDTKHLAALKCIEAALVELTGGSDCSMINHRILDHAATLARRHYKAPYQVGRNLAVIASFLSDKSLVPRIARWKNPISRPNSVPRTGKVAAERREARLPTDAAMDALAELFFLNLSAPRDVATTSFVAIATAVPSRGSEIVELLEDCEVEEKNKAGKVVYGLRFRPKKEADPEVKWVPDPMIPVVKEAIKRVRDLTAISRHMAAWWEDNPGELYPFPGLDQYGPNDPVPRHILSDLFGSAVYERIKSYSCTDSRYENKISKALVNDYFHSKLPPNFPYLSEELPIKYRDMLFCMQDQMLRQGMDVGPRSIPWAPTVDTILSHLSTSGSIRSIFVQHGFCEADGSAIKVTTHQFRHMLNTMGQRGGLSQAEIARWSGRRDIKQNREYDHRSEFELVEMLREHDPNLQLGESLELMAERIAKLIPMTRQEFNQLSVPNAHITEVGFCVHDFVFEPCPRFRDCNNCTEQVCIKGDRRLTRIKELRDQIGEQLAGARAAKSEGAYGADRWEEHHDLTEKRLTNLIEIMEDPTIPDGSIIRLANPNQFSRVGIALRSAASKSLPSPNRGSENGNG